MQLELVQKHVVLCRRLSLSLCGEFFFGRSSSAFKALCFVCEIYAVTNAITDWRSRVKNFGIRSVKETLYTNELENARMRAEEIDGVSPHIVSLKCRIHVYEQNIVSMCSRVTLIRRFQDVYRLQNIGIFQNEFKIHMLIEAKRRPRAMV